MKTNRIRRVEIGDATLYHGDCFRVLPRLDIKTDAVISDMPFGITNIDWDQAPPLDALWNMLERRTKQSGNFVLFSAGKFTVDLISSRRNFYRYDLVWAKSRKCGFLNANLQPMRAHESILVFVRPGFFRVATYNPQKEPGGKTRITTRNHKSSVYDNKGEHTHVNTDGLIHPCSVLPFSSETGHHPTQKPLALMEWLVKTYTNEGDTVLDMFCGSGTTGVACINTNRKFVGIERDERYFDIAVERIRKANDEVNYG